MDLYNVYKKSMMERVGFGHYCVGGNEIIHHCERSEAEQ